MEAIKTGMILYHGSYTEIKEAHISKCLSGKDFGKGFYLTPSYEQAKSFVSLSVKRNRALGNVGKEQNYGFVNVYEVIVLECLRDYYFESANLEWLHFVAGNRDKSLFKDDIRVLQNYNVIVGKIANDRTAATLQAYIDGINGEPGDVEVDRRTIEALLPNRLENQYCFRSDEALKCLKFKRSDLVTIDG